MTAVGSRAAALTRSPYQVPRSFYLELAGRISWVRSLWYSLRFRGPVLVGRRSRVLVHRSASLRFASGAVLMLGLAHDGTAGAVLRMRPRAVFDVGGRVQVMRGASISVGYDAALTIGAGTFLNDDSVITCDERVSIGSECALSWGVRILDTDVHQLVRAGEPVARRAAVSVGDRCWIGTGATVLKGVTLDADCVVAAGAMVTRSAGPGTLLSGSPARAQEGDVAWHH